MGCKGKKGGGKLILLCVLMAVLVGGPLPSDAQEAWCLAYPANCICSEPLTSPSYTADGTGNYYKGTDANSKPCNVDSQTGYGIRFANSSQHLVRSDSATLNKLPNRNTTVVTRYLSVPEGWTGDWVMGAWDATGYARVVYRYYIYRSANFVFSGQADNCNTKDFGILNAINGSLGWLGGISSSNPNDRWGHMYNLTAFEWAGHTYPHSGDGFLNEAPRGSGSTVIGDFIDQWVRVEIVVRKPDGPGHDVEIYTTKITSGSPTQQVVKLSNGCIGCMWDNGLPYQNFVWDSTFRPHTTGQGQYATDFYRSQPGPFIGPCDGWAGALYLVVAGYSTDAGQMIGAASEVEGGSPPARPVPPAGVMVR